MKKIKKLRTHTDKIGAQVREKVLGYVLAGFGLVAGLAWNEAIKDLLNYVFPLEKSSVLAKFIYALVVTLVFVLISVYLVRLFKVKKSK